MCNEYNEVRVCDEKKEVVSLFFAQHHGVVVKRRQNGRWTNGLSRFKGNLNQNNMYDDV